MRRTGLAAILFTLCYIFPCEIFTCKYASACISSEREALIKLRRGLKDPFQQLASWDDGPNCCTWAGITCDNKTRHVTKLDLHSPCPACKAYQGCSYIIWYYGLDAIDYGCWNLSGQLDPALVQLKHLHHLDLSWNAFYGIPIPGFLGSMEGLQYLNLSHAGFSGMVPKELGNLSTLQVLDISSIFEPHESTTGTYSNGYLHLLSAVDLRWLPTMLSLKHLEMKHMNLSAVSPDWIHSINAMPSLENLHFSACSLQNIDPTPPVLNSTTLRVVVLSYNRLNSSVLHWLTNLPNLQELDLSFNNIFGGITKEIGKLTSLKSLDLSLNEIDGSIPKEIGKLANLKSLDLSFNKINGNIPKEIGKLANLKSLDLSFNKINGSIPKEIGKLMSMKSLDLSNNQLIGTLPATIGQLSNLYKLYLSSNFLHGPVCEAHFQNMSKLKELDLSSNSLVFQLPSSWIPPFDLSSLNLASCHLGSGFLSWLRNQRPILDLNLANTSISSIPSWFWNNTFNTWRINLSNNMIKGQLPNPFPSFSKFAVIDLSCNIFSGPVPRLSDSIQTLDISNNHFAGPIPANLCNFTSLCIEVLIARGNEISGNIPSILGEIKGLRVLDLSKNNLHGTIPMSLGRSKVLEVLDLSENQLSGTIEWPLVLLNRLEIMHLEKNTLSGRFPASLRNCTSIEILDIGENKFDGDIPAWIGHSFPVLGVLRLRANSFTGHIPSELSNLTALHILDAAENFLQGSIPKSLGNLTSMKQKKRTIDNYIFYYELIYGQKLFSVAVDVSFKGKMQKYTKTISLLTSIDFSSNNLSGQIPSELLDLFGLIGLNLSHNHLLGKMPINLGNLSQLESLDLSWNNLSGEIPTTIANLNFLEHLNLSCNNLSGRIPFGQQLRTLDDPAIYAGNMQLCGPPLSKCPGDESHGGPTPLGNNVSEERNDDSDMLWFYVSMGIGFVFGFWGICGVLVLQSSWRIAYFHFFDNLRDWIFVKLLVRKVKLESQIGRN